MEKPTLYMETSVPSYLLAGPSRHLVAMARQEITRMWWRRDHARFAAFVSDSVLQEAARGDAQAAKERLAFLAQFPVLQTKPEVLQVTELYIRSRIVPPSNPGDATHLAFATVYEARFLCTWNFKHLANAFTIHRLRNLNERVGLFTPQVCTPEELLGE